MVPALRVPLLLLPHTMSTVILFLGDSYTIGEGVAEVERWPSHLLAMLGEGGVGAPEGVVVARTGWTADELREAIEGRRGELAPGAPYPLVTLLVGVNDQYRGGEPEAFRPSYRRVLAEAVGFAWGDPRRVVVPSIPDWGVTPFAQGRDRAAIAGGIDGFNAVVREEVERMGGRFVDITPLSRERGADPAFLAEDGLHYSGAMYRLWAARLLPAALEILGG
jgi:lysophospholipase L1-like esterase